MCYQTYLNLLLRSETQRIESENDRSNEDVELAFRSDLYATESNNTRAFFQS